MTIYNVKDVNLIIYLKKTSLFEVKFKLNVVFNTSAIFAIFSVH